MFAAICETSGIISEKLQKINKHQSCVLVPFEWKKQYSVCYLTMMLMLLNSLNMEIEIDDSSV